jgi:hypothetical protein
MVKKLGYIVERDGECFYITESQKVHSLDSGAYTIELDTNGALLFKRTELSTNHIVEFPDSSLSTLRAECDKFLSETDKYEKYNLVHKRGILLHGKSGTGKTATIHKLLESFLEKHNAIAFFCSHFETLTRSQICKVREIEPDRPIVVVLEHLESLVIDEGNLINTELLEFLDGVNGINHVLFLATTSDLSLVPDSLKKRPSRFDLKVEINLPSATDREYYFTTMIPENELKKIKLENWIKDTDGYTISHLQELITSYFIYGQTYKASISNIRKLINGGDKGIGFELADTLEQE